MLLTYLKCKFWLKLHQITPAQDQTVLFIEMYVPSVLFMQNEYCLLNIDACVSLGRG